MSRKDERYLFFQQGCLLWSGRELVVLGSWQLVSSAIADVCLCSHAFGQERWKAGCHWCVCVCVCVYKKKKKKSFGRPICLYFLHSLLAKLTSLVRKEA